MVSSSCRRNQITGGYRQAVEATAKAIYEGGWDVHDRFSSRARARAANGWRPVNENNASPCSVFPQLPSVFLKECAKLRDQYMQRGAVQKKIIFFSACEDGFACSLSYNQRHWHLAYLHLSVFSRFDIRIAPSPNLREYAEVTPRDVICTTTTHSCSRRARVEHADRSSSLDCSRGTAL